MKAVPLLVVLTASLLLMCASATALPDWLTGMAGNNPDDVSVLLYHNDDPVGTANPDSHGREKAVMVGDVITVTISAREGGEPVTGKAFVDIRQGSDAVMTIAVDVTDGAGATTFIIPAGWDGNYHVEAHFEGLQDAQNEFKVQGYRCHPEPEVCDGIDNDCDGVIDDIEPRQCGESGTGACKRGNQLCVHGSWTECQGLVEPEPESCDGNDNNCNGLIDEGLQKSCGINVGQCKQGTMTCVAGGWGACAGDYVGPSEEVCDGIDNDCDGLVDEGLSCECTDGDTKQCGSDAGECRPGMQTCSGGQWGACEGGTGPSDETCDGKDNNCNGQIDEDVTQQCGVSNVGQCRLGVQRCDAGQWGQCEGASNPSDEVCDGLDNDCDGQVDESVTRACGTGGCLRGTQSCQEGRWGACSDISGPQPEVCDGLDNDCNGQIDDLPPRQCGCDCASARVLFVKDRGHHNEDIEDFDYTVSLLRRQKIDVTVMDEPYGGLRVDDVKGFDLVWFVNPGWPMDTKLTLQTLTTLYDQGYPIVLQGDDMTWGTGELKQGDLEQLTHLHNIDNGLDQNYTVTFASINHPLLRFLRGESFMYDNDDIDTTTVQGSDVTVLARGYAVGKPGYGGPAIIVRDDTPDGKGILLLKLLTLSEVKPQWQAEALVGSAVNWLLNKAGKCECGSNIGACKQSTQQCQDGAWGACEGVPPMNEVCNGIDDNCNGQIDEGITCECKDGDVEACGTGIGECKQGSRVCSNGAWGACVGSVGPQPEICDGIDNNCDGQVDENIVIACGTSMRAPCRMGVRYCVDGELGPCQGAVDPISEICDGKDNNCDGQVDEGGVCECDNGDTRACEGVGMCAGGVQHCDQGVWGACQGAAVPQPEICNGVDDDCDGRIDEDLWQSCGSAVGQCTQGMQQCVIGQWSMCVNTTQPSREVCDGLDNDCDGLIDNGVQCQCRNGDTQQCGRQEGICTFGSQTCADGQWDACDGGTQPQPEICDGLDNDCNGIVDDIAPRACGVSDVGVCRYGQQRCADGAWNDCSGAVNPSPETCDGLDNNCDGRTDEGCVNPPLPPVNPPVAPPVPPNVTHPAPIPIPPTGQHPPVPNAATIPGKERQQASIHVDILAAPATVSAIDRQFGVQARVTNTGTSTLPNVVADASASVGWSGERVPVGTLAPNESRVITVAYANILCPDTDTNDRLLPRDAVLLVNAHSGDIADDDNITRGVTAPPLGVLSKPVGANLRTCIVIGNQNRPLRDELEIELEVYDQQKDEIVDFLSPVVIQENQTIIKVADYPLNALPLPKIYRVRANMYENGSLFSAGYHVAEARSAVDLSTVNIVHMAGFWESFLHWLGVV